MAALATVAEPIPEGEAATLDPPPYLVPHSQEAIRILYRDQDIVIVDKPHLLLSVPGRHPLNKDSLISRLANRFPAATAAHRLDLDTSGLMVVPHTRAALSALGRAFQQRHVDKAYRALLWGELESDHGSVELPIITDWHNRPRQKICHETGKHALTRYEVLARGNNQTLVTLFPVTGRSHQLRIHMAEIGHPILGCDMYAHPEALAAAPRLLLHATQLSFAHPIHGFPLRAVSPAPFGLDGCFSFRPG